MLPDVFVSAAASSVLLQLRLTSAHVYRSSTWISTSRATIKARSRCLSDLRPDDSTDNLNDTQMR
eukprot:11528242-Heterocapsa_arctica.AAC.1